MQPTTSTPHIDRLRALPKAEVHAHLEGCFEPTVLEQWAIQAGVPMPRPRDRLLQFEGLADFLHFLDWACGLASTRERLAESERRSASFPPQDSAEWYAWARAAVINCVVATATAAIPKLSSLVVSCKLHVVQEPQSARPMTATSDSAWIFWRVSSVARRLGVGLA